MTVREKGFGYGLKLGEGEKRTTERTENTENDSKKKRDAVSISLNVSLLNVGRLRTASHSRRWWI